MLTMLVVKCFKNVDNVGGEVFQRRCKNILPLHVINDGFENQLQHGNHWTATLGYKYLFQESVGGETKKTMALEGRVAIVTGASRGIGREIALHLAQKGAKVVVHYSSNQTAAEEVASIINNSASSGDGVRAVVCKADVAEASQVAHLFDTAEQTFGRLHIVVNNAGILDPKYPTILQTSDEDWDRTFQVNCKGAFLCSREAAKRVVRGGGGRIINLTSSLVGLPMPEFGAYTASKAAVEMMTRILAQELRGTQITANCVAPGAVATDLFFTGRSKASVEATAKSGPFERLGKVGDVAPLIAFLASDEGEWVNAQVVRVNGGRV